MMANCRTIESAGAPTPFQLGPYIAPAHHVSDHRLGNAPPFR